MCIRDRFEYLLEAKPKDETIPLKATQLVKAGLVDPYHFVDLALNQAYQENDQRLFDQLNQLLLDSSWGLDQVWGPAKSKTAKFGSLGGGFGRGRVANQHPLITGMTGGASRSGKVSGAISPVPDRGALVDGMGLGQIREMKPLPRVELVDAIGGTLDQISSQLTAPQSDQHRKVSELGKKLLPALYKQLEFKFDDKTETATPLLHSAASNTIAVITGVKASELHNGYDIKHWVEKFLAAKSDSEKLQAIQNVFALRNSPKIPDDLALSIAKGVRGMSFDYVDFVVDPELKRGKADYLRIAAQKSVQALAIELFWSETEKVQHFVDSLNQLADEDAMFALWVLKRATGNQEAISYIRLYQGSNNPLLKVRATVQRFKSDTELSGMRSEKLTLLISNLEEESLSTLQRLMILASIPTNHRWGGENEALFELVNEIDDPRQLATLFSMKYRVGLYELEIIALKLIAKNPDYLHDVHEQLLLDCWISPKAQEKKANKSKQTLLDLCLAQLDRSKKRSHILLRLEETPKAIENLKSIKTKATDIQRNRIDRILKLIKPLDSEDSH